MLLHDDLLDDELGTPTSAGDDESRLTLEGGANGSPQQSGAASRRMLAHPLYATDHFRMFCFKITPCRKRFTHDWSLCPFAHRGERARRRPVGPPPPDGAPPGTPGGPWRYSCQMCPAARRPGATCPQGDACGLAHNTFERWLHPDLYKVQLCRDGRACRRVICFFAHFPEDRRPGPMTGAAAAMRSAEGDTSPSLSGSAAGLLLGAADQLGGDPAPAATAAAASPDGGWSKARSAAALAAEGELAVQQAAAAGLRAPLQALGPGAADALAQELRGRLSMLSQPTAMQQQLQRQQQQQQQELLGTLWLSQQQQQQAPLALSRGGTASGSSLFELAAPLEDGSRQQHEFQLHQQQLTHHHHQQQQQQLRQQQQVLFQYGQQQHVQQQQLQPPRPLLVHQGSHQQQAQVIYRTEAGAMLGGQPAAHQELLLPTQGVAINPSTQQYYTYTTQGATGQQSQLCMPPPPIPQAGLLDSGYATVGGGPVSAAHMVTAASGTILMQLPLHSSGDHNLYGPAVSAATTADLVLQAPPAALQDGGAGGWLALPSTGAAIVPASAALLVPQQHDSLCS